MKADLLISRKREVFVGISGIVTMWLIPPSLQKMFITVDRKCFHTYVTQSPATLNIYILSKVLDDGNICLKTSTMAFHAHEGERIYLTVCSSGSQNFPNLLP